MVLIFYDGPIDRVKLSGILAKAKPFSTSEYDQFIARMTESLGVNTSLNRRIKTIDIKGIMVDHDNYIITMSKINQDMMLLSQYVVEIRYINGVIVNGKTWTGEGSN